jgi:hypothetical protein
MTEPSADQQDESQTMPSAVVSYYTALHDSSVAILKASLSGSNELLHAESHAFISDLELWIESIRPRKEIILLEAAAREYQYALFALVQGHYRHSFGSLRLFIELSLSAIRFSTHELLLREWLAGKQDVNWQQVLNDDEGIFSPRFTAAFYPDLKDETSHFRAIAAKLYRECSEYVHGNLTASQTIPDSLSFDLPLFEAWHERAKSARLVLSFALFLRYFDDLKEAQQLSLESSIRDQLDYLEPIRTRFGSATTTP